MGRSGWGSSAARYPLRADIARVYGGNIGVWRWIVVVNGPVDPTGLFLSLLHHGGRHFDAFESR